MAAIINKRLLVLLARLALAGVFVTAALPKIEDPAAFGISVAAFRVIDSELSAWVALLLPWLELVIGLGILLPVIRRTSGALIALLLLLFITLHLSAWARGLDISCGCFGAETGEAGADYRWLILRNLLLLGAVTLVHKQDRQSNNTAPLS
ncbi:MAG: MauE/DoxX family redox-associated membrane protein [Opitutae bacterium]|nr:MauE/DoxX family redox-associated membrane protein [Opitutae bacterium]MDG1300112.1 MauE/DoxX family redox-associated membrane protein [Opitutae bacterium]